MNVDGRAGLMVKHWHVEPGGGAGVGHPYAAAAGRRADADAISRRHAVTAGEEAGRHVDHLVEVAAFDQSVALEYGAVGGLRACECRGVRSHRTAAGRGLADLMNDQRLAGLERFFRHAGEFFRRLHGFEQQQKDVGVALIEHVIDEVGSLEGRFIAGRHNVAEVEIARARAVEESETEAPALRDHRHLDAAEAVYRLQRSGVIVHRRAESGAKRGCNIGEALGVRTADRHFVTPGGGGDLALQAGSGLARLLGKTGAENDGCFDTGEAATLDLRRHIFGRYDQNR
jgi:hypothetical protein